MLIRRLLAGLDPDAFCLLTSDQGRYQGQHTEPLATGTHHLPPTGARLIRRDNKWLYAASAALAATVGVASRTIHVARIARRERCTGIVAFTGDFHDLPACYLASRLLGVPLHAYIVDDYANRELHDPIRRRVSSSIEHVVVRAARRVIANGDTLADALADRHGVRPTVIVPPADLSLYASEPDLAVTRLPATILFTGTVYTAQADAARNLLAALAALGDEADLHVYGGQSEQELRVQGMAGNLVVHPHAGSRETADLQRAADVLFLPLAFRSPYPEIIRTAVPMKFGEYLASGTPVLVHAPAGSFVAEYGRRHDCCEVVDVPEPRRLADAVRRLLADDTRRARLSANARARAHADFSITAAQHRLCAVLGLDPPPDGSTDNS